MIKFHNTLSGNLEYFKPHDPHEVKMYHCGPTVYGIQHIGNLSMFVFTDILRRALEEEGYRVKQVINFTDFGHLSSDADEGEDKMTRGLKRDGLEITLENMLVMAKKYAKIFLEDLKKLNIKTDETLFPYASEYVPDQIELIRKLEEKGYTYKISDGIYFDTAKFSDYGKLGGLNKNHTLSRVAENSEKKNHADFALWKLSPTLGWESPWGKGFPGWHIECSAMIIKLLGEQIDIHTGGVEHIPIHHNNEIAQSEAATGKEPFSRFWLHRAHLQIGGEKIAKSEGNVVYLSEIVEKGFSPLAFRYLLLNSTYRTSTNFTWEALEASENAYRKLKMFMVSTNSPGQVNETYFKKFSEALADDLNTPRALAVVWQLIGDEAVTLADKQATLLEFDGVLGLDLKNNEFVVSEVPTEVQGLLQEREKARKANNFSLSDELREKVRNLGFEILDTPEGSILRKL